MTELFNPSISGTEKVQAFVARMEAIDASSFMRNHGIERETLESMGVAPD